MKKGWVFLSLLPCLVVGYVFALERATTYYRQAQIDDSVRMVLPPTFSRLTSLEFRGCLADYKLLESMVFYGKSRERRKQPVIPLAEQSLWLENELEAAIELDPYFYDPYYLAAASLPWDFANAEGSVRLLVKGMAHRRDDWTLPYYVGFQEFFFLNDDRKASEYLMAAAALPDAPREFLTSLAVRLAYKGSNTEVAIAFLGQMLRETNDPKILKDFAMRLQTLQIIRQLEQAVNVYERKFGYRPENIDILVEVGIVKAIPPDPFGGRFFVDGDGMVKTTSDLRQKPKQ